MRWLGILLVVPLVFCGCHGEAKTKAVQKQEQKKEPEYVGDSTAPTEIRALRDAKEVRKQMEEQEQERNELQQRD